MGRPGDSSLKKEEVLDEIRAILADIGMDPADINPTAHLVDDLDLDSLDWADLAIRLEETLAIVLREEKFASMRTVQDVVDRVHAALVEARGTSA